MAQQRHVVVLLMLACLFTSSYSYQFTVGGKDGWVPNPSVDYNTWSQHMRFIINDSVLFKYKQGADSVLEVSKDDYDKCNTGNPIKKMEDGNSVFTLDRSGPFYFISGKKDNCDKGQKLQIIVISARNQGKPPQTPAPGVAPPSNGSTTPSPTGSPPSPPSGGSSPAASPPKGSSTPGTPSAPSANAPAGSTTPGASSPNGAPAGKSPTSSPTPSGSTASPPAPATGGSLAPVANGPSTNTPGSSSPVAGGPSSGSAIAPSAGGPSSGSAIAPSAGGPSGSAGAPAAGGPSGSAISPAAGGPAGSMSPGPSAGGPLAGGPSAEAPGSIASGPGSSNTPADINSPAGSPENPNSFAVKAFTPSVVLVSAVSLVLTVAL